MCIQLSTQTSKRQKKKISYSHVWDTSGSDWVMLAIKFHKSLDETWECIVKGLWNAEMLAQIAYISYWAHTICKFSQQRMYLPV